MELAWVLSSLEADQATLFTVVENHQKCRKLNFLILAFFTTFVLLRLTYLVTLFGRKFQVFKKSPKLTIFGIFNQFLSTQNVNVARFARNVECDFLGDFQTLWLLPILRQTVSNAMMNIFVQRRIYTQCLKIPKNVAFFKNSSKLTIFGILDKLLSTQNVNVARFARNVKCDFFCDFQPLCYSKSLHLLWCCPHNIYVLWRAWEIGRKRTSSHENDHTCLVPIYAQNQ